MNIMWFFSKIAVIFVAFLVLFCSENTPIIIMYLVLVKISKSAITVNTVLHIY